MIVLYWFIIINNLILSWFSINLEITKNLEFLTGRKIVFDITSFTFSKYLKTKEFKNINSKFNLEKLDEIKEFYKFYKNYLDQFLEEYLTIWWYPEIVLTSWDLRQQIAKDIIEFLRVENITSFNNLIKILASQIWNLVNKSEINSTLWISINSLVKYLEILE